VCSASSEPAWTPWRLWVEAKQQKLCRDQGDGFQEPACLHPVAGAILADAIATMCAAQIETAAQVGCNCSTLGRRPAAPSITSSALQKGVVDQVKGHPPATPPDSLILAVPGCWSAWLDTGVDFISLDWNRGIGRWAFAACPDISVVQECGSGLLFWTRRRSGPGVHTVLKAGAGATSSTSATASCGTPKENVPGVSLKPAKR